ncbi:MAG TPA: RsmG family class I SAM-dependent methyltransferase [Acidimicrobiales bacterium]|nr:RsmG family class I SAM-dependent methyltransferase [Acidimicrobiales bacterium]
MAAVPDAIGVSEALLDVLAEAQALGAIGPASLADHVAHAAAFADLLAREPSRRVLDLGSGGGLPGLVVAELLPEREVVLLEGRKGRAAFLAQSIRRLELGERVRVLPGRAEELGHDRRLRANFEAVVARGFGGPGTTAECAAGFLAPGGRLVVSEPPGGSARWEAAGCSRLGLALEAIHEAPFAFAVLRQVRACPGAFPRRVGIPAKRPLF